MQLSPSGPTFPVLATDGLSKSFGEVRVLQDVSIGFAAGEVHGLVGENGAGKSTLIKCLAGALTPDAGAIRWRGTPVALTGPADAQRLGLGFIHQELNLVPFFDAVENVFLGRTCPTAFGRVRWSAMRGAVSAVSGRLAPDLPLDVPVARLSPGQQQIVAILRAFLDRARVVVMDEPTAALGTTDAERLLRAVAELKAGGAAVVYVSHRLEEVLGLCDRVSVLRDGRLVASRPTAELDAGTLVRWMSGSEPKLLRPGPGTARGQPVFTSAMPNSSEPELVVHGHEVVGVYGLLGSGRSRLLRRIYGAERVAPRGRMTLAGAHYVPYGPRQAIRHGVVHVPEDRRSMGLVLHHPVRCNLSLPLPCMFRWKRWLPMPSRAKECLFAEEIRRRLRVDFNNPEQHVGRLSGGNQQKILLGRWLSRPNRLYLLDEPTRGIDVATKAEVHRHIRRLAADGAGIFVVTSDLAELLELSDRVVVMRNGEVAATLGATQANSQTVLDACYGR